MTHKNETAWTWGALNARMGKRDHLKVMHNTTARRATATDGTDNGCIVIRYHQTDVITLTPSTDARQIVQLDTGGWHTVTTAVRLNATLRADHGHGPLGCVGSDGHGGWSYSVFGPKVETGPNSWDWSYTWAYRYAFGDGMVIDLTPGPSYGHPMPAHRIPVDRKGSPLTYADATVPALSEVA